MRMDIDSLVAAVPGATSRTDGPAPSHPWEDHLRALERTIKEPGGSAPIAEMAWSDASPGAGQGAPDRAGPPSRRFGRRRPGSARDRAGGDDSVRASPPRVVGRRKAGGPAVAVAVPPRGGGTPDATATADTGAPAGPCGLLVELDSFVWDCLSQDHNPAVRGRCHPIERVGADSTSATSSVTPGACLPQNAHTPGRTGAAGHVVSAVSAASQPRATTRRGGWCMNRGRASSVATRSYRTGPTGSSARQAVDGSASGASSASGGRRDRWALLAQPALQRQPTEQPSAHCPFDLGSANGELGAEPAASGRSSASGLPGASVRPGERWMRRGRVELLVFLDLGQPSPRAVEQLVTLGRRRACL
jgi:hypothetical protein